MELIFELFIRRLVTHFIGLNARFLVLKIFDNELDREKLKANGMQEFYNLFVGLILFIFPSMGVAYIFYKLKLL